MVRNFAIFLSDSLAQNPGFIPQEGPANSIAEHWISTNSSYAKYSMDARKKLESSNCEIEIEHSKKSIETFVA